MPSITLANLGWSTPDGRPVLSDIDLRFQRERVGVVGRNGVGKSTLLYLLTADGVADIPFGGLAGFVRAQDAGVFERAGFLVSPRFGLAFVPGEPDWVTALAPHCLDTWRHLGSADAV